MLKKILSYGFVEGLAKGLNKLTLLALPLLLNTADFGKVGLLVSIELILPLISLMGLERAVLRFYGKREDIPNFNKTVFSSVLWLHLFILLALFAFYAIGLRSFFGIDVFPDIFLIVLLVYFQGTNLVTLNMLRVQEDHKKYFHARLFLQVLKFCLVFLCVYTFNSYIGYLIGAIIAALVVNTVFRIQRNTASKERFDKRSFATLFAFSWPFVFHGIAGNLLGNADKFILEHYMSLNDVGLYTLAYSYGSAMAFAYIGISVYMEPMIYREDDLRKREILLNKYLFLAISSGTVAFVAISIASRYLLPIIYKTEFSPVFEFIPLIAMSFLIYPFYLKSNYSMIYEKRSLNIAILSVFSALLSISLNIYFIPIYGIYAAVFTTMVSYAIQAFIFVVMANKFKELRAIIDVLVFGIILGIGVYFKMDYYYLVFLVILYLSYFYYFNLKYSNSLLASKK